MTTKTSIFARLYDLSQDLWWTGDPWANDIFQALDPVRWEDLNHNPCALLLEYQQNPQKKKPTKKWITSAEALLERYQQFLDKPEYPDAPAFFSVWFGLQIFPNLFWRIGYLSRRSYSLAGD